MDGSSNTGDIGWRAIVITCTSVKLREALEKECRRLADGCLLPKHEFLFIVDDPRPENESDKVYPGCVSGVGSGGATINAILVAIERLSAYHDHTMVNSELVYNSRILVVHHGRSLVHSPGGSAFLLLDSDKTYIPPKLRVIPPTLLQHAIWMATKVGAKSQNGVWVISLDVFLPYSPSLEAPETEGLNGAVVCTVQTSATYAQHHGTVLTGEGNAIDNMHYKMPLEQLNELFIDQNVSIISGLVFLSASLTEQLLGLHVVTPLDRCTYYGTDSGIHPLQISLYFDLVAPMCSGVNEEEYLLGQGGAIYAKTAKYDTFTQQEAIMARLQIWKVLKGMKAKYHLLDGVSHHYLGSHLHYEESVLPFIPSIRLKLPKESFDVSHLSESNCIYGTLKGNPPHIMDSWIDVGVTLNGSVPYSFCGFRLQHGEEIFNLPDNSVWQCYLQKGSSIVVCYGMRDRLTQHYEERSATLFNEQFSSFLERTGISREDLWPHMEKEHQTLLNAKIYSNDISVNKQIQMLIMMSNAVTDNQAQLQWMSKIEEWKKMCRVSLFETAKTCDLIKMMMMRESMHLENVKKFLHVTSHDVGGKTLLPLFQYIATRDSKYVNQIIHTLHLELSNQRESTSRLLANVADLLGCMAAGRGGLRSGPAANLLWKNALLQLKAGNQDTAVIQMENLCQQWIASGHPEDLVRAARHYERASQIVISNRVETAQTNVKIAWDLPNLKQQVKHGEWVEARCPARFDLAGGWSDTPPICYEQGGAVLNIAVKVNGEKPIGAKVRFVEKLHIVCTIRDWSGGDLHLTWTELNHLRDYDNPVAQGALVKAVLLYCHAVDLSRDDSLATQLEERYGGGIEIEIWSWLAKGSGLGGSSLLAGTLAAALAVLFGHPTPHHAHLIHATLVIEQWLTTGGGWQDQVGGLIGGAKLGISKKGMPLTVTTYRIPLSQEFITTLNNHLLLLYTGKVRLARNLLQTVIRNWYAREDNLIECFSRLPQVALNGAKAMLDCDLKELGCCINEYWNLKKRVASGCEPVKVSKLMASLRDHCYGMSLAGAGGGGYLYALKAEAKPLAECIDLDDLSCDIAEIDSEGIQIKRNGEILPQPVENESVFTCETWKKLLNSF